MDEMQKRCPECNALCGENDTYCKKCGKSFVSKTVPDSAETYFDPDETINDIPVSEITLKLQKNTSRYLKIFKKNEDAKYFGSFNFAAALLSIHWFFYRKMYKIGLLVSLISSIIVCSALAIGVAVNYDSIMTMDEYNAEYEEAKEYIQEFYLENEDIMNHFYSQSINDKNAEPPEEYKKYVESLKIVSEQERNTRALLGKLYFYPVVAGLLCMAFIGVFADCIYRNFLLNKKHDRRGGVSRWWMYVFVANSVNRLISYLAMVLIIAFILLVL